MAASHGAIAPGAIHTAIPLTARIVLSVRWWAMVPIARAQAACAGSIVGRQRAPSAATRVTCFAKSAADRVRVPSTNATTITTPLHHARIEIGTDQLAHALEQAERLESAVLAAGFESAAVDPEGYRSGGAG